MDARIGDMHLPQAVVARILKEENVVTSKESREVISRAAAVFLINLSGIACQSAKDNKHKTISADDVVRALRTIDNNAIYTHCKKIVDEMKVVKDQKLIASRKARENAEKTPADDEVIEEEEEEEASPTLDETME